MTTQQINRCTHHKKTMPRGYAAWFEEAERRKLKGQKQRLCPECGFWLFKDEMNVSDSEFKKMSTYEDN